MAVPTPFPQLIAITPDLKFPSLGTPLVKEFENIRPTSSFSEMIPSWNVENPHGSQLKVEVRVHGDDYETKWYSFGTWSYERKEGPRESVKGQGDTYGTVDTDTLSMHGPGKSIDIRLTLTALSSECTARLRLLTFAFSSGKAIHNFDRTASKAWGRLIDVPFRAQGNYPNGGVLCSPTSVSMLLWHYSTLLNRPELNLDVPIVEDHVWDSVYKGAGNWPFNTAHAGSQPGMTGYVARLSSIVDLEHWILAGLPVICSVSFDLLRGLPLSPQESGHLVVLIGFDPSGNPIMNDPAYKTGARRTYKRDDFERAWTYSNRTVYFIYPDSSSVPDATQGMWLPAKS